MKLNSQDTKGFIIGVIASITAVIVWDIIKNRYKIFNYKSKSILQKLRKRIIITVQKKSKFICNLQQYYRVRFLMDL